MGDTRVVQDSIEKEVRIDAPVEVVWAIVTRPEHIGHWLGESAEVDLRPGGAVAIHLGDRDVARGTVERVERPVLFSFRWVTPESDRAPGTGEGYETLVELRLRADGDGTVLRLAESGFAALAGGAEEGRRLAERHTGGWGTFLDRLAAYAAETEVPA